MAERIVSGEPVALERSSSAFRTAAARYATGVAVVTTVTSGVDHAMTANSFTSVSLDPLLVLVCVEHGTRFNEAVLAAGIWGVSVLDEDSQDRARWFSTVGRPLAGQFDRVPHHRAPGTGVILLDQALARFDCRTVAQYPGGDHDILVGEVLNMDIADSGNPLIYWGREYRTLAR